MVELQKKYLNTFLISENQQIENKEFCLKQCPSLIYSDEEMFNAILLDIPTYIKRIALADSK